MLSSAFVAKDSRGLSQEEIISALDKAIAEDLPRLKKVLIVPPDFTRYHSGAGAITAHYYALLHGSCQVDVMPALGTHAPMTAREIEEMYPGIPPERFIVHDWRHDVTRIGEVPGTFVEEVSGGLMRDPIAVEVNRRLLDPSYDLILSVGQVVPHEVVGMANRNKNIFVGCGGAAMINGSHMLGAFYGLERIMGKDFTPVRRVFDYAETHFLSQIPLVYVLTVTTQDKGVISTHGLFIGRERALFERAVALSQRVNLTMVDEPFEKVVVLLDEREFKSTWLGNKAVYRTRMAIADGGELIVLAPGVEKFGEDPAIDALIRKYGYCGRENVLRLVRENDDLRGNLSAAAHLIHGSGDGRFSITYCTEKLSGDAVRGVHFGYMPYGEAVKKYDPARLTDGYNTLPDGETVYYISNPALGLWADRAKF